MCFRQIPALTAGKKRRGQKLPESDEEDNEDETLAGQVLALRKERREAREREKV